MWFGSGAQMYANFRAEIDKTKFRVPEYTKSWVHKIDM